MKTEDNKILKNTWILIETKGDEINPITYELATLARKLGDQINEDVCGIIFSNGSNRVISQLEEYGIDKLYNFNDERLRNYSYDLHAKILKELIYREKPRIFACGSTSTGNELAKRIAATLKVGLFTNCTEVEIFGNQIHATSLIWQGKLARNIRVNFNEFAVITLTSEAIDAKPHKSKRGIEIIEVQSEDNYTAIPKIIGTETLKPEDIDLKEADIIIAVGKGVGRANLHLVDELGNLLGGSIGASRAVVDEGWIPYSRQIGQTGKTVMPKLYVACGISGQLYHVIGMKESQYVAIINTDRNAPFTKMADLGLIGDFGKIASSIVNKLKK